MEYFVEYAVNYLRSKLLLLIEREPTSFEELHVLVQDLLDLQEDFQRFVNFVEDITQITF